MPLAPVELGFVFLLAVLGFLVPLLLIASQAKRARSLAIALIIGGNLIGCFVAALCFWRGSILLVDFSRFTPFPFALGIDRLSALFLLLICTVAAPVSIFAVSYFDTHYGDQHRGWVWAFFSLFLLSLILVVTASTRFAVLVGRDLITLPSARLIHINPSS